MTVYRRQIQALQRQRELDVRRAAERHQSNHETAKNTSENKQITYTVGSGT